MDLGLKSTAVGRVQHHCVPARCTLRLKCALLYHDFDQHKPVTSGGGALFQLLQQGSWRLPGTVHGNIHSCAPCCKHPSFYAVKDHALD